MYLYFIGKCWGHKDHVESRFWLIDFDYCILYMDKDNVTYFDLLPLMKRKYNLCKHKFLL